MLSFYLQYEKPATIPQGWGIVAGNVSLLTECLSYRSVPFILTLFVLVYDAKVQTKKIPRGKSPRGSIKVNQIQYFLPHKAV